MRKIIYLALILTILLCCVHKQEKVERILEDGVEVVLNHRGYSFGSRELGISLYVLATAASENPASLNNISLSSWASV